METYSFVMVLIWPVLSRAQYYHLSELNASQPYASSLCTLGTPDVDFPKQLVHLDTDIGLQEGQRVWLGYAKVYQTFLYRGCASLANLTVSKNANISPDPGLCNSFCGSKDTLFGFKGLTCYCIEKILGNDKSLKTEECHIRCNGVLCGDTKHLVSVYEQVNVETVTSYADRLNHDCLSFNGPGHAFEWSYCNDTNKLICRDENSRNQVENTYSVWPSIMVRCIQRNELPVDPKQIDTYGRKGHLWTGMIRRLSILPLTDVSTSDSGFSQGYIEYTNNEFQLKFLPGPTKPLKALCVTADKNTDIKTTTSSPGSHETTTNTAYSTTRDKTEHVSSVMTSPRTTSSEKHTAQNSEDIDAGDDDTDGDDGNDDDEDITIATSRLSERTTSKIQNTTQNEGKDNTSNLTPGEHESTSEYTVAVGLAVPAALIIIVAVVICFLRKRKAAKQASSIHDGGRVNEGVDLSDLGGQDRSTIQSIHNYDAVMSETFNANEYGYDTTGAMSTLAIPNNSNNVYNRLEVDSTYNHVGEKAVNVNKTDNVYNTSEKDDTYNKLHDRLDGQTDNVYNKTESTVTYDTGSSRNQVKAKTDNIYNTVDVGYTYSEVSRKPAGKIEVTDDVYNKSVEYNTGGGDVHEHQVDDVKNRVDDNVLYCIPPD